MIGKYIKKHKDKAYFLFRLSVGLLFMQHGLQKLFGMLGSTAQAAFTLMWFVGAIEFLGGFAIALGFFTRLAALGTSVIMVTAYFRAHFPQGIIPIMNRGELALLYLVAFLIILVEGAREFSLEKMLLKKEVF